MNYTIEQERANIFTHRLGLYLSLFMTALLMFRALTRSGLAAFWSSLICGLCMLMLFAFSVAYHKETRPLQKARKRLLDHLSIFFLIAGTYTPYLTMIYDGWKRIATLLLIWGLALGGVILKTISFYIGGLDRFENISLAFYIGMGLVSLFFLHSIYMAKGLGLVLVMGIAGAAYLLGTIFYRKETLKYSHAIWHIWVLAGSIFFFIGIYFFLL